MKLVIIPLISLCLISCEEVNTTMMKDASDKKDKTLPTAIGEVETTQANVGEIEQKIRLINAAEKVFVAEQSRKVPAFVKKYTGKTLTETLADLKLFDESFEVWLNDKNNSKESANEVMLVLGTGLGNIMALELEMDWVLVNDKYGEDWAVQHANSQAMAFPFSSIDKRIESKEVDFIEPIFYVVQETIKENP